jgi:hypothetical protein
MPHSEVLKDCPPWDECFSTPLKHDPCHDEDWFKDREDRYNDHVFWHELWHYFRHPDFRSTVTEEKRAKFEEKYARCQRIEDKRPQSCAEIQAFRDNCEEELTTTNEVEDRTAIIRSRMEALNISDEKLTEMLRRRIEELAARI